MKKLRLSGGLLGLSGALPPAAASAPRLFTRLAAVPLAAVPFAAVFLVAVSFAAVGCGGGSGGDDDEFAGTWDVQYNLVDDDCQLVAEQIPGFVDQYFITDGDNGSVTVTSTTGFLNDTPGVQTGDGSFEARNEAAIDPFGDGTPCSAVFALTFTLQGSGQAQTLFQQTVSCANGFRCASNGPGLAIRQDNG